MSTFLQRSRDIITSGRGLRKFLMCRQDAVQDELDQIPRMIQCILGRHYV